MWVMSKHGFYSIVQKDDGIHVRTRERADLEQLQAVVSDSLGTIRETPENDYRWRVVVDYGMLKEIMLALGGSVNYPNFKAQIDADPVQRHKPYHDVWAVLAKALGAYGRKGSK
jgi:hypothetical protein